MAHQGSPRSDEREEKQAEVARSTPAERKFIPWEVFYMSVAALEAQRSNCTESTDKASSTPYHACMSTGNSYSFIVPHSYLLYKSLYVH